MRDRHPSSLVYAINVPHHAPILLGAMYIENGQANGPQVGGSLTRWHAHLVVCQGGKPTVAGFRVQLRGFCDPGTWHDRYTAQMLHVWVVPLPGRPLFRRPQRGGDQRRGPGRPRREMTAAGPSGAAAPSAGGWAGWEGRRAGAGPTT
jgi:hypothetical protein